MKIQPVNKHSAIKEDRHLEISESLAILQQAIYD